MLPDNQTALTPDGCPLSEFSIALGSGKYAVRDALEDLKVKLGPLGLDLEEIGTIELVLAETLNNILEHAYVPDAQDWQVNLSCIHADSALCFTVEDHGKPMPGGVTPLGMPANVDVDLQDLPEGGFGWFLIKDLAKDIQYGRFGDLNRLTFRMILG